MITKESKVGHNTPVKTLKKWQPCLPGFHFWKDDGADRWCRVCGLQYEQGPDVYMIGKPGGDNSGA